MVMERFAVYLVSLDPVQGIEIAKTRPCVIVSPDDVNDALATVIIAPMTTVRRRWPTRPAVTFQGQTGEITALADIQDHSFRRTQREKSINRFAIKTERHPAFRRAIVHFNIGELHSQGRRQA